MISSLVQWLAGCCFGSCVRKRYHMCHCYQVNKNLFFLLSLCVEWVCVLTDARRSWVPVSFMPLWYGKAELCWWRFYVCDLSLLRAGLNTKGENKEVGGRSVLFQVTVALFTPQTRKFAQYAAERSLRLEPLCTPQVTRNAYHTKFFLVSKAIIYSTCPNHTNYCSQSSSPLVATLILDESFALWLSSV